MFARTYLLFILIALLVFAACAPSPTQTMDDGAMEQVETMEGDEMADGEMADGEMADGEMADGEMADEMMGESEMMTDTHAMTDTMMSGEGMSDDEMSDDEMSDQMMDESEMMTGTHTMSDTTSTNMEMDSGMGDAMMDLPAWQTMALTDARTGESFTLADFAGKQVFVETMATWCTNCRQQLGNVKSAAARADGEQVVFIAISVETDLAAETLAQYADANDFGWTFAVATPDMVRALADTFGPTIANPPATPHFWIYPDGAHSELATGYESGDEILAQLAG